MQFKLMWKVEKTWRGYLQYNDRKEEMNSIQMKCSGDDKQNVCGQRDKET
jgi:hypothetical protein